MPSQHFRFRDLPAAQRAVIRDLHRLNPWWNLKIIVFALLWAGAGTVAIHSSALPVWLACYFIIGATLQGFGILMHEAVHGIMFRNRTLNRWIGFLCGLPTFLSVSAYRVGHLPHHRHARGGRDPDELENVTTNPRLLAVVFTLTLLIGELFGFYRVGPFAVGQAHPRERRDVLVEYMVIAGVFATAFALVPFTVLLHVWILPAVVATQLTNVRTLAEHVLTDRTNPLTVTRTVVSNRFVSFFMCNLNYHIEHHLFPAVPWYHLPQLHRVLGDDLERSGAQVYRSYTRFLTDLGMFVLRAWGPGGRDLPLRLQPRGA